MSSWAALKFALGLWAATGVALAQEAGRLVFQPDFFAAYEPQSALDMVQRVPGFSIDEGEDRRGFAGAQGNVLIDGEPPATKAQEIEDILARIPASGVLRIELVRAAGAGTQQSQLVNVIRRVGGGEGVWTAELAQSRDGRLSPSAEGAYSGRWRGVEYGVSAALDMERAAIRGERSDFDAVGMLNERRVERLPTDEREARAGGELSFDVAGWRAGLNAQLSRAELDEQLFSTVFDASGIADEFVIGDLAERETIGELALSLRRERNGWRSELAAIVTRTRFSADESSSDVDAGGALDEASHQRQRVDSGETILRGAVRRTLPGAWSVELGAEATLNTLEQRLELTEDDGSGPAPVVLPSANVRVEEQRGEARIMLSGPLSPRWSIEAGGAFEASVLTQSGDADAETTLSYFKPTLQLVRALGEGDQLRLRIYRDVGQLDFEDFVSAADLQNTAVDAGNPDLVPETSWRVEAGADWRFGEDGVLGLTFYHWSVEDALDVVPIGAPGNRFDAPGNIGDATLWGARIQLALPLPFDAELRLDAMAQRSEATDPLTGESREISAIEESAFIANLRQDLGAFAWGVDYEREVETPEFRLDRIETEREPEELTLWIETTAFGDLKLRAWAENVNDSAEWRRRSLFDPDRLGGPDGGDVRARRQGVTLGVSASGRF
ncbi:MAG TPA: TonB-dependent receptor [Vitreimonas sp.]|nr:TonB-dependent receptor [Vitreimonas sp.]